MPGVTRTSHAIRDLVQSRFGTAKQAADAFDLDPPHLHRLIHGRYIPSAKTVGVICRKLEEREARTVIDAFIQDELRRIADELGLHWSRPESLLTYRLNR